MLIRRCAILALTLATAGMLLGQSIEPRSQVSYGSLAGDRMKGFVMQAQFIQPDSAVRF